MMLMDVNVLVYAFRKDTSHHIPFRNWLGGVINSPAPYAIHDLVLSGFLRVTTHPKIFKNPSRLDEAIAFADVVRGQPNCHRLTCGPRHWDIFIDLCRRSDARGNLVADAFLAALAIESGCEWISADHDYSRFPGLRWRNPLCDG